MDERKEEEGRQERERGWKEDGEAQSNEGLFYYLSMSYN